LLEKQQPPSFTFFPHSRKLILGDITTLLKDTLSRYIYQVYILMERIKLLGGKALETDGIQVSRIYETTIA